MPNKLPELYLYTLIPGAKQPSRWNMKFRNRNNAASAPPPVPPPVPPSVPPSVPPPPPVMPNVPNDITNDDDDDGLATEETETRETAVTNVSFSMKEEDRESYKSGVSVTFGFTPTTASPSSVKLNYPSGFFSTYPTPTCTVSVQGAIVQGTIMTPGAPGDNAITLSVTGTALAAGSDVTVNLIGCKMGSSMSAGSITVQTDGDISPSTPVSSGDIEDNHKAKALVITCIDFRLIDEAIAYLNNMALLNEYDEMIVAGASLGYNTSCYNVKLNISPPPSPLPPQYRDLNSATNSTLWTDCVDDHINISSVLHSISEIIVIDHLGCGAYNGQFGGTSANPINIYDELKYHVEQLNTFRTTINGKYKNPPYNITSVIPSLMSLDGSVDVNPTHWDVNLSFNLKKYDVFTIGQEDSIIPFLPLPTTTIIPTTTMSSALNLKYELLNSDMTAINSAYASVNKGSTNWNIQNLFSGNELPTDGTEIVYNLRVAGTNAYIILTMTANVDDTVKFAFSQGVYTSQSGWKVWN